jgi:hypothetical protein
MVSLMIFISMAGICDPVKLNMLIIIATYAKTKR